MESTITTSIFDSDVDKSQLPPIDQKRLVAFVNHFVIDTSKFLNSFLCNCENKFVALESRLQKINAGLLVVESKIFQGELKNSVPSEEVTQTAEKQNQSTLLDPDTVDQATRSDSRASNPTSTEDGPSVVSPESTGVKVCDDVRYEKYFKMKQFGVPAEAVKLKMSAEGLDPAMLDDPNRILEDGIKKTPVADCE